MKATSVENVNLLNTISGERAKKSDFVKNSNFSNIMNSLSETDCKNLKSESDQKSSDATSTKRTFDQAVEEKLKKNISKDSKTVNKDTDGNDVNSSKLNDIYEEQLELNSQTKEYSKKIKDALLSALDISQEDLESAMELLGINYLDCLDKNNMAQLLAILTGNTDVSVLITDETLYQKFNDVMAVMDGLKETILTEMGLTEEELAILQQKLKQISLSLSDTTLEEQTDDTIQVQTQSVDQNKQVETVNEMIKTDVTDTKDSSLSQEKSIANVSNNISGESSKEESVATQTHDGKNQQSSEQTDDLPDLFEEESNTANNIQEFAPRQEGVIDNLTEKVVINEKTVVDTESILRQIQNQFKVSTTLENTKMEFQLNPENLGKLTIQLASKDGVITAQITAQNNVVKEVIESQILQLRENMNNQGLKVEAVEVTVESHEFERNLEQGNSNTNQDQYEQQQKKTRRLINFNDPETLEDLSQEETLIANMMIGDGNSLNYTV